ncbi:hypothetical protein ACIGXM_14345 [Kitasatospora sp. NPDC052896]|uniref:hypothetical protein n=1 Tax=Kitasatospora sp. NPDC052896 TaxID=3364061 RepID=UPI0037C741B2
MADVEAGPVSLAEAGVAPERGGWYQLLQDYGSGVGMLTASVAVDGGEVVRQFRLLDVFEGGTPGIGALDEESPVLLWLERTGDGVVGAHHVQFRMQQFLEFFGVGEEPPEWEQYLAQSTGG